MKNFLMYLAVIGIPVGVLILSGFIAYLVR